MSYVHYQNQSYQQETVPSDYLQHNYGSVPPYPYNPEYLRQPSSSSAYPVLPPLHQQPSISTHIPVQPAPVHHVRQSCSRVVFVQQREDDPACCLELFCTCTDCVCTVLSSLLGYVMAIVMILLGLGLAIYFLNF